jgi:hypothetical protein
LTIMRIIPTARRARKKPICSPLKAAGDATDYSRDPSASWVLSTGRPRELAENRDSPCFLRTGAIQRGGPQIKAAGSLDIPGRVIKNEPAYAGHREPHPHCNQRYPEYEPVRCGFQRKRADRWVRLIGQPTPAGSTASTRDLTSDQPSMFRQMQNATEKAADPGWGRNRGPAYADQISFC